MGSVQQVELKTERFERAYRLLFAYAFIRPDLSRIAQSCWAIVGLVIS
jgi:hypothetical protein